MIKRHSLAFSLLLGMTVASVESAAQADDGEYAQSLTNSEEMAELEAESDGGCERDGRREVGSKRGAMSSPEVFEAAEGVFDEIAAQVGFLVIHTR